MNEEVWKIIEGYEDYMISSYGRVLSMKNKKKHRILKHALVGSKKRNNQYYGVSLSKKSKKKTFKIHILVGKAFIENPDNLPSVDHINSEQRLNNNVTNLRWADNFTQQQNKNSVKNAKLITFVKGRRSPYRVCYTRNKIAHSKYFLKEEDALSYRKEILAKCVEAH